MSEINLDLYYDVLLNLVMQAGKMINENISSRNKEIECKSSTTDFVTKTDKAVEKLLIDNISKQFPDHKFIAEESYSGEKILTDDPTWIIDPIDGTMNFVHSFPHSCVSIALFVNKIPEIGVIYNPTLEQLFTARRGRGAFLNGRPIRVSGKKELSEALIMMEVGGRDPEKRRVVDENQKILMPQIHGLRSLGSAALNMAMVACGAAEAYFDFALQIWDIAAGELIITEAGGVIMDPAGGELQRFSRRVLVASSKEMAENLIRNIVHFYPTSSTTY
ncbi:unnamed protein product [Phaedon cochleariae]|uniref:Inositol-1-monophosphatase n=1 Tax=Phaedon cochleariae TaxID=80249 RepID=A0A9P0GP97_PHACE|nr:unnamed protein product [Phaedon cochleariae]